MSGAGSRIVVIGVGNEFRRDDAAGPAVIGRLAGQVPADVELLISDGDPVRLMEMWSGASLAVVVDAVRADPASPGRMHRFIIEGTQEPASAGSEAAAERRGSSAGHSASTHGLGLDEAIGLAMALDRMPERLIVHAIEAADTAQGTGMTPEVAAAVGAVATEVRRDLAHA
jgi:hydrogenase maturation protease